MPVMSAFRLPPSAFVLRIMGACVLMAVVFMAAACSGNGSPTEPAGGTDLPDTPESRRSWAGSEPAPPIPGDVAWFNVERPLTLEELKGRVVLLDFWTLGCINCQHIIPDLKRLEAEFGDNLLVIGVHSGKYATEHDDESILEAVRRFGIEHPVINDPDFVVWRTFGASAWPTLVLIDPAGNLVGGHAGEGVYPLFQPILESLVAEFGEKGLLAPSPLPISLAAAPATAVLSYPGNVLADEASNRLYIADSGHNRVLEAALDGSLVRSFGIGKEGFADGAPGEAAFRQPHGLALSADRRTLYVADTRNHAVRAIDLASGETSTIAGTGVQLQRLPVGEAPARETAMASPWDLAVTGGRLFVSMAGIHQIWSLDLLTGRISVFAGTSREGIDDGPRLTMATLAQPSGLATDGETLYWVDPESSALRRVPTGGDGNVETLVGTGLFDYGDRDGLGKQAQLQHPQGVALLNEAVYIADTYNHRIRVYEPISREVGTAAGSERGWSDGVAGTVKLDEPGGLSAAGGLLYIADTNNHLVRVYDPGNGSVSTLTLTNLSAIAAATPGRVTRVDLPPQRVAPGATNLRVTISSPADFHLNGSAPSRVDLAASNDSVVELGEQSVTWSSDETEVSFPVPVVLAEGQAVLTATVSAYYCRTGAEALCFIGIFELNTPVEVTPASSLSEMHVSFELPPAGG